MNLDGSTDYWDRLAYGDFKTKKMTSEEWDEIPMYWSTSKRIKNNLKDFYSKYKEPIVALLLSLGYVGIVMVFSMCQ